jgi:hypothetical protein
MSNLLNPTESFF